MKETLVNIEKLLGAEFDDAPRELKAIIRLILIALDKKKAGRKTCGEAFNNLRHAANLVNEKHLTEWQAELNAVWALYYLRNCPNLEESGKKEENLMWHHIAQAHRLEPDNKTLNNILSEIEAASS